MSMGLSVGEEARMGNRAVWECEVGTRWSVQLFSRVKQFQKKKKLKIIIRADYSIVIHPNN
jgi:hypothetical protein